MAKTSTCPDVNDLNKLAAAELPPDEMEPLLQHLQECDACLARARAVSPTNTLMDILVKAKTLPNGPADPLLAGLITRLSNLGQAPPPASGSQPLAISCAACGKTLKVKAELAGKKVKCPGCGKPVSVPGARQPQPPVQPARSQPGLDPQEDRTMLPSESVARAPAGAAGSREEKTLMPHQANSPAGPAGVSPGKEPAGADATQGLTPQAEQEVFDFLRPAQQSDELGRLGTYRILKKLGAGGMGMVFLAEDTLLQRRVALKIMLQQFAASAQARERFLREARSAASIEHEHIVPIFQVGEDNQVPFLAMPFLKGEPLDVRLERDGKLPLAEALRIAREMAEGLAAAHANNLIHRDIKPGNVWLEGKQGKVRLLDFGLARAQDDTTHLTQTGTLVGTPAYMAPEQAKGEKIDGRADLFSLGCVLYLMLTGKRPFRGNDTISLLMSLAVETPPLPALVNHDVPNAVSALTMRLLAKEAGDRPASAQVVADELAALAQGEPSPARDQVARTTTQPSKKSRKPVLVAGGLILAALLGGLLLFAPTLFRIATNQGELIVEIDDPEIEVLLKQDGVLVRDKTKQRDFVLTARAGQIEFLQDDVKLTTRIFELTRGGKTRVKVSAQEVAEAKKTALPPPVDVKPLDDDWSKAVAAMPAEQQVKAVADKLKERNPDFNGKVAHADRDGEVRNLTFLTDHVTDISPVRALTELAMLECYGSAPGKGKLIDLSPLKNMKLSWLNCRRTKVADLSPLKNMKLVVLSCENTKVSDLSPLKDMKVADLDCSRTLVSDLTPLKDMPLRALGCQGTKVTDLTPLQGMPLKNLDCDFKPERDAEILRSIKTLATINGKPVAEFWKVAAEK